MSFSVRLSSLSTMPLRSVRVVADGKASFCGCARSHCTHAPRFPCPFTHRRARAVSPSWLSSVCSGRERAHAFRPSVSISFGCTPRVGLLHHVAALLFFFFFFEEVPRFSQAAAPIYLPTNRAQGSLCATPTPTPTPTLVRSCLFDAVAVLTVSGAISSRC